MDSRHPTSFVGTENFEDAGFRSVRLMQRSRTISVAARSSTSESLPTSLDAVASFYYEDGVAFRQATQLRNLGHSATTSHLHGSQGAPGEERPESAPRGRQAADSGSGSARCSR